MWMSCFHTRNRRKENTTVASGGTANEFQTVKTRQKLYSSVDCRGFTENGRSPCYSMIGDNLFTICPCVAFSATSHLGSSGTPTNEVGRTRGSSTDGVRIEEEDNRKHTYALFLP